MRRPSCAGKAYLAPTTILSSFGTFSTLTCAPASLHWRNDEPVPSAVTKLPRDELPCIIGRAAAYRETSVPINCARSTIGRRNGIVRCSYILIRGYVHKNFIHYEVQPVWSSGPDASWFETSSRFQTCFRRTFVRCTVHRCRLRLF